MEGGRSPAQPVQPGDPRALGNGQQPQQVLALGVVGNPGQLPPQPRLGPFPDGGDQALQGADPRQQDLGLDQPGGGVVEQHDRTLVAQPAAHVQPAGKREPMPSVEVAVAVGTADLVLVVPARLAGPVAFQVVRVQAELLGDVVDHHRRGLLGVGQERAQEPGGTQLQPVSELISRPAAGHRPAAGCRVQVEEPAQLPLVRIGVEPAVPRPLFLGQEVDRHPRLLACVSAVTVYVL